VEAAFACLALLVAAAARAGAGAAPPESAVYLAVALAGWIVGAEFPLANRLFCLCGGTVREAAALTAASDQAGAAAGALAVGVFLAPVLGVGGSCIVLAAVKGAGLLCVYSARLAAPPAGEA
jgi:spermidine synthase